MTDAEILNGLKTGDRSAANEMAELYANRLLRSAFLLIGSEAEAQDLVQETFLQAFRSARKCRGTSSLYTWLHGILLNLRRRHLRKQQRMVYTDTVPEPEPSSKRPHDDLDVQAASEVLLRALEGLSVTHREVVVLRYYNDMRIDEIAQCTKSTQGTVKSRLFYAKRELRKLIPENMNLFS